MEKKDNDIKKYLEEPVYLEKTEGLKAVKNTLFTISVITIYLTYKGVTINTDRISFLGLSLDGITQPMILSSLAIFIFYSLIHFLILSAESFKEYRLRCTGFPHGPLSNIGRKDQDFGANVRQMTLHYWWSKKRITIDKHLQDLECASELPEIVSSTRKWIHDAESEHLPKLLPEGTPPNMTKDIAKEVAGNISPHFSQLESLANKIEQHSRDLKEAISSERITASLEKFDNSYRNFWNLKNSRWFLFEFLIPSILSVSALLGVFINLWGLCLSN